MNLLKGFAGFCYNNMEEEKLAEFLWNARVFMFKYGKGLYPTWDKLNDKTKKYFIKKATQILTIR